MTIDTTPIIQGDKQVIDLAKDFTIDDLRQETDESINKILSIIEDLDDADVTFEPHDPEAYDPHASQEEQYIGWSIAHLVAHVTASSEEGAALSSLLARGFPTAERPRYETPWRQITTKEQVVHRLEESRRMRHAYLDTWPDEPFLDVYRDVSPRFTERVGLMNAPAAFLFGLIHEQDHHEQFRDVAQQAREAHKA